MKSDNRGFLKWFFTIATILFLSFGSSDSKAQSKKLVTITVLKITFADDTWVRASIIEEGALRIDEKFGERLFITPVFDPLEKRAIRIKVLRGNKSDSIGILEEIGVVNLSLDSPKISVDHLGIRIELEAILKRLVEKKDDTYQTVARPTQKGGGSTCCVSCNGRLYCANCSVQTSCGCCNTSDCPGECG